MHKMNVTFETDVYCLWHLYIFCKTPATEIGRNYHTITTHSLCTFGVVFWSLTCRNSTWQCGSIHRDIVFFLFTGWMELLEKLHSGWSNCWVPPGAAVELLKKTVFARRRGVVADGEGGMGMGKRNRRKKILEENLTFLSEVEHALLMPHMECFESVSNKYFDQKSSYSKSLHIIPQGKPYKDIAVRV